MQPVGADDVERMRDQLFFDGEARARKLSRFWLLLTLAAVIASAGVVGDSTATVIGAMIVAPLMTPILGTALAGALGDRSNLVRSIVLVTTGALVVIAIAWVIGSLTQLPVDAAHNSQVAGRVSPRLIDLTAALATGAVGAVALARSDISDTLPGVAIAISLVPPLAVVGLTLESGVDSEARGALLLFVTNVSAILAMGTLVLAIYGVQRFAVARTRRGPSARAIVFALLLFLVAIPLAATSRRVVQTTSQENTVRSAASDWARPAGWELAEVTSRSSGVLVRARGPLPAPDPDDLRTALDDAGLEHLTVAVELEPVTRTVLAGQDG